MPGRPKAATSAASNPPPSRSGARSLIRCSTFASTITRSRSEELRRLYGVAHERFLAFMDAMATRANPGGITDRAWIDQKAREYQDRAAKALI